MKRKYILSGLLACALTFSRMRCRFAGYSQKGVENEENYYQTDEPGESAIAAVYASWRNAYSGVVRKPRSMPTVSSRKISWQTISLQVVPARPKCAGDIRKCESGHEQLVENYYKRRYATIYLANLVIERFDAAESEVKARNIAEAKFFRAICYFELTTLWGTPLLVDKGIEEFGRV